MQMVLTEAEIAELDVLAAPLIERLKTLRKHEVSISHIKNDEDENGNYYGESSLEEATRRIVRDILDSADVSSYGGCQLCCS